MLDQKTATARNSLQLHRRDSSVLPPPDPSPGSFYHGLAWVAMILVLPYVAALFNCSSSWRKISIGGVAVLATRFAITCFGWNLRLLRNSRHAIDALPSHPLWLRDMESDGSTTDQGESPRESLDHVALAGLMLSGGQAPEVDDAPAELTQPQSSARDRSSSFAEGRRQSKRVSLTFPLQTSLPSGTRSRPQSWISSPSPIVSPEVSTPSETNFLTVLATQERRVLELKEELAKAEADLLRLKRSWATQEALKKRNDVKRLQQLQPLNTTIASLDSTDDDADGSSMWMQKEMERRKTLMSGVKQSHRKVFSGSRHTRTLSLLSPDKQTFTPSLTPPPESQNPEEHPSRPSLQPLSRSATTSDIGQRPLRQEDELQIDIGALQRTGKQMVGDLRDGLWTFFEDIRQATVGEEGVNATEARHGQRTLGGPGGRGLINNGSRSPVKRPSGQGGSIRGLDRPSLQHQRTSLSPDLDSGATFWKDNGLSEPTAASASVKAKRQAKLIQTPEKVPKDSDDESSWDAWDTPERTVTGSAAPSSASDGEQPPMTSDQSTPRTSTSSHTPDQLQNASSKRDSIPWPQIAKLPSKLTRTASHLLSEWERSLTPPIESRATSPSLAFGEGGKND
ncbi:hypothetical protein K402DRAFT_450883 [Aulographum hederae CBS 113979]|uniref:DUF4048 domain-containing protein n=1 Tax=Aulographum hederae CBS 113979 TaxID=1176131 RepID=A0A6G1HE29_9PEZI|nr:hypothetical protein K402DRAFT_450883 [Aulographum hederae CBS 113979]